MGQAGRLLGMGPRTGGGPGARMEHQGKSPGGQAVGQVRGKLELDMEPGLSLCSWKPVAVKQPPSPTSLDRAQAKNKLPSDVEKTPGFAMTSWAQPSQCLA